MLKRWLIRTAAGLSLCGLLSCVAATCHADPYADSPYIVDVWPTARGLPQSSVIAMIQGRNGYLWLGTLNGLVRFDGMRFTVFDEANTPELDSNRILLLFEDSQTNLWIGTDSDTVLRISRDGQVRALHPAGAGRGGRLRSACEDSTGAVWLYLSDGRLCRYRDGRMDVLNAGVGGFSSCRAVIAEKSGSLWIGTDQGLFALDPKANLSARAIPLRQFIQVRVQFLLACRDGGYWRLANGRIEKWKDDRLEVDLGSFPGGVTRVNAACEDSDGHLIIGTQDNGVFWYKNPPNPVHISSQEGLSHDTVLSLCMDGEGDLWVGTDGGGLDRVKAKHFRVLEGSQGLNIQSVCADGQGGVWFASPGAGAKLFHWNEGVVKPYDARQGLPNANVLSVLVDGEHRVWAGTAFGLFILNTNVSQRAPGSEAVNRYISAIYQDRKQRLWFGTQGGLARWDGRDWNIYTTRDGLSSDSVRAIIEDAAGNLWIGTERGGLNCLRDGKLTVFRKSAAGLPSDNVSALWVDSEDVLWVGTSGGLARLQDGKWTRYTTSDGLAGNGIGYLIGDAQSNLWIGSYAGLMRVSEKSLNDFARRSVTSVGCRLYGESDGLPTSECAQGSQPGACRTPDGRLWFTTIKGLVSVDPAELKPNPYHPPIRIESVLVDDQVQNTNPFAIRNIEEVIVPPGKELLEIRYTSLNLGAADRTRFRRRLEGYETKWTDVGNERMVRYSNLPPGLYRFQVTACNEDGVWNDSPSTLAIITVQPPFWRTWWFKGASAAALLGMLVALVYYFSTQKLQRELAILKHQEELERERARIARDLHDQLGANLTQVSLLGELTESDKSSPADVESHAQQISQTARETTRALDEIVWAVNPSNDTLEGLISYACKYAQEYLEMAGLRYRLDVPAQLPDSTVAPEVRHNVFLAFKEAVNNVVKHAQASVVSIRLRLDPGTFTIEIEDNGRGLSGQAEKAGRNGLRNMRKRMDDAGGTFFIGPAPQAGTLVRLTAPVGNR
jgi:ligand-binding sensor domain-containing protein/signal transduction histidine kinase